MNIIPSARPARLHIIMGAAVLAIAGLITASQVAPAGATPAAATSTVGHDGGAAGRSYWSATPTAGW